MRASDLAEPYPVVDLDTDLLTAARTMGAQRLPGLIVRDAEGRPWTILPGSQMVRVLIPHYVQEDPALARVIDEQGADELWARLRRTTVRELLPARRDVDELPVVEPDATSLEVAAVMARMRSPIVAVVDGGQILGAVTVSRLLEQLVPEGPEAP